MLNKIIEFSIRNKLIIGLFVMALIGVGVYETSKLPFDAVPDITENQVQIITIAPSFGATDIERLVTFPIEQANSSISGIKEIRSFSRFGLSLVTIVFDEATDIYWARQQVSEKLQKIQNEIPKEIGIPEMGPISTGLGEIYQYVVRPKKGYEHLYDATELRTIQDWIVRRQLMGVKGVAEVSSFGGKLKQFEVSINTHKLESIGVTIQDVFTALENNNQNTGGSYIEKGPTVLFIRSEGLIGNVDDIENVLVKASHNGTPILIKDVAEVNIGYSPRFGAMCYNDEGEVAGAVVMMLKGANSNQVIKNVKERIESINQMLPEGVVIEPFLDRSKMVVNAISTVKTNLLEGALIVVFILVLFLGNFRAGLLVASVIPLAMLFAIIMMNFFGVSGNLMSLGALDFGLIVDGAVIIVEAVMHQLSHSKVFASKQRISQKEMDSEVGFSASRMMNSAVFGQIIILIVYIPILTLSGIEGKMFKPMAQTVAFALIGAFLLSLTYIPMMSTLVLSKKIKHKPNYSDKVMFKVERNYQKMLSKVLRYPKYVIGVVTVLFILAIFTMSRLGGEFIPALEEGDFAVDTRVLTGSNLTTTIEYTQKAAGILKTQFPEVEKVVTKIGSGEVPTDPMPMEAADMMVILKDKKEWTSAKTFPELAEKMGKALEAVPGITAGFQYPVQMRFNELMTGARQDVVCKIFGENLDTLAFYAQELGGVVSKIEGAEDLYVEPVTGIPQIVISYNRALISQYNLTIQDINKIVNTAFAGQSAGLVYEGEKRFDLVVRLDNNVRSSILDIRNLLVPTTQGVHIPLHQLADVSIVNGPNQIQRENTKRRIVVGFNVRGRDVQSIVEELETKVANNIALPVGYTINYGGAFENLNEAKKRLSIAVPISLLLIFILLYFAFGSVKQGLLIYSAIPLSAIGGIFFLAIRGMPFSISAGVGFIALFGVAVLNGIVLVAEFNRLRKSGYTNLNRIVIMGTKVRLRPVLMTAFVASLGFLPMALSNGAGAEVQRPLATVVIGGLLLATFLTLFVLPILYIVFDKIGVRKLHSHKMIAFLFFGLIGTSLMAQNPKISLENAIDTAITKNLEIKNQTLMAQYSETLKSSGYNVPLTEFSVESGQVNSVYFDSKINLTQTFSFPTVYSNQKKKSVEEWNSAVLAVSLSKIQIKKTVTELYYHIVLLRQLEKIIQHNDSMLAEFIEKATLRFSNGESNILEKTFAENQRGKFKMQLNQLVTDIEISILQFNLILNSTTTYEPEGINPSIIPSNLIDSSNLNQHPILQLYQQQIRIANAQLKIEKSKLLPDFSLGYFNQSIQGMGADDIFYQRSYRFQGFQVGIGIPLFYGSQSSKINASKSLIQIAENQLEQKKLALQTELSQLITRVFNEIETVKYYENVLLPNIKLIEETANKQMNLGQIDYLEWMMLISQTVETKVNYIDAIRNQNFTLIQINYLTSTN